MKHFLIDKNYGAYLAAMGFSVEAVLKKALLPEGLFARQTPSLTAEEYFRFMQAVDDLSPDRQTPVRLAASEQIGTFSPPVLAAYCSRNALGCLKRLAQYKPLIGALCYRVEETETEVSVEIDSSGAEWEVPEILIGIEFVFLVSLIRRATQKPVKPVAAAVRQPMKNEAYGEFIGVPVNVGAQNRLVFSEEDALLPFISCNDSMREFVEPELKRRLSAVDTDDSCAAQVRNALMELLPSGACTIDDAAQKLGYSKRSLQRRLQKEKTSFQKQLNHTRELMAKTCLANTDMAAEEIAFLLGYQETGSFFRAFAVWTGQTASEYRAGLRGDR